MNLLSRFGGRIWDPWREIGQLQHEVNRLLGASGPFVGVSAREYPPVNVHVKEHDILLTLEVPGIDPAKIDVTVTGDTVAIQGERPVDDASPTTEFHRRERPVGKFSRTLQLPFEVDPSRTEASYAKGVLSVKMTRPESLKPKKVAVKVA